jgi:DNA replication protein DnaC
VVGNTGHGDVSRFFPDAESAECRGNGKWATVTPRDERGSYPTSAECPLCAKDYLTAAIRSLVPPRFRAPIEIPAAVTEWAGHGGKAQGLYLTGQVGTGKTHAAWMAVAAWCEATGTLPGPQRPTFDGEKGRGPAVIFTRMTDLLDDLRPGDESRHRIRECQNCALLAIDDLGAEKASEWTQERFYSIIDHRYANCLPLIVTSNLPPSKLADQTGERAASRLAEMCTVVAMTGTDRRKPGA